MKWLGVILFLFLCVSNLLLGYGVIDLNVSNSAVLNEVQFTFLFTVLAFYSYKIKWGLTSTVSFILLTLLSIFNLVYIYTEIPTFQYITGSIQTSIYGIVTILIVIIISKTHARSTNK